MVNRCGEYCHRRRSTSPDVPLGTLEDEYGRTARKSGATNIGPSLSPTAVCGVHLAAATDERFTCDTRTGRLLWQTKMSTSCTGPMTYVGKDGRQYVVIAAGDPGSTRRRSANEALLSTSLVAFALPRRLATNRSTSSRLCLPAIRRCPAKSAPIQPAPPRCGLVDLRRYAWWRNAARRH